MYQENPIQLEEYEAWLNNKLRNPRTKKKIKVDGSIYKYFDKIDINKLYLENTIDNKDPISLNDLWIEENGKRIIVYNDINNLVFYKDSQNNVRCFEKESIDEIYACHVVEHISRHDVQRLFTLFFNILKPDTGILRISVPDIEKSIQLYNSGVPLYPTLYGQFWGGQKNSFDYHTCGFDFKTINDFLLECNFKNVTRYDWKTFLPKDYDDYSKSYIPHMDFDNGINISLNIIAHK
jgi:phage pi2 protein 07